MKKVTFNSIKNACYNWSNSNAYTLDDLYITYSGAKQSAYEYCRRLYEQYNGRQFKVWGANSFSFSAGFIAIINGVECFVYITKSYDRYAPIPQE